MVLSCPVVQTVAIPPGLHQIPAYKLGKFLANRPVAKPRPALNLPNVQFHRRPRKQKPENLGPNAGTQYFG